MPPFSNSFGTTKEALSSRPSLIESPIPKREASGWHSLLTPTSYSHFKADLLELVFNFAEDSNLAISKHGGHCLAIEPGDPARIGLHSAVRLGGFRCSGPGNGHPQRNDILRGLQQVFRSRRQLLSGVSRPNLISIYYLTSKLTCNVPGGFRFCWKALSCEQYWSETQRRSEKKTLQLPHIPTKILSESLWECVGHRFRRATDRGSVKGAHGCCRSLDADCAGLEPSDQKDSLQICLVRSGSLR